MIKNKIYIPIAILFLSLNAKAQYHWSFEKGKVLAENSGKLKLEFISNFKEPELVKGFKGTAIRTDGYSSQLNATFPVTKKPLHLKAWFALETFSNDTSGFFVLKDTKGNWISACVDKFGKPLIGLSLNGILKYHGGAAKLLNFEWMNVGLSVEKDKAELIINGEKIATAPLSPADFAMGFSGFTVGRDGREKQILIFPTNALNGIVDEVSLETKPYSLEAAKAEFKKGGNVKPDLSVAASRFQNDFNRPKYHILPAANWTNEMHGLIYYNGKYHLFNQKNGANLLLNTINWGHYSSPDLISWTEHRPALSPEQGIDERGIWSGHSVIFEGKPALIYTAGAPYINHIGLAFPNDSSLISWQKYSGNPIVKGPPQGYQRTDLRDPYVWKENDTWYMMIGYGVVEDGEEKGSLLLYKSKDFKKWDFLHTLFTGDPKNDDSGVFWEMPVFWKMDGKYILLVNKVPYKGVPAVALYWVGDFVNEKFVPDFKVPKRLEVVNRLLSPSVALDVAGRTTAIAIIPDEITAEAAYKQGWNHLYSIPRTWKLKDGEIYQRPHPALEKLRMGEISFKSQTIKPGNNLLLASGTHQLEFKAELNTGSSKKFGFIVGKNKSGSEQTRIYYDFEKHEMIVDDTQSSKREHVPLNIRTGKYNLEPNSKVDLHVFIDGSVVEVFINGKDAFTTRLFPLSQESTDVELFTEGGNIEIFKASVWHLRSSNNKTAF